jgi:aryl-alcohol dehydrogenase-like predicted oxidoreductase
MNSKLILGTVQMGLNYGINNSTGKISFDDCCDILSNAFRCGLTILDTAEAYGDAHRVIGDFHRLNQDKKFKIITKVPYGVEYVDVEKKIIGYLENLNVNCLEVLMFHSFDTYKLNIESLDVLLKLKKQGQIKYLGVSVYTNEQIEELLEDNRIDVVQLPFNLLDNEKLRGELISQLKGKGKIVHTRSVFLQGLFFKDNSSDNNIYKALINELSLINNIVKEENTTITNLALSYCLEQKNIDNVLIGVDSLKQLEENLKVKEYTISKDAFNKINAIKVEDKHLLNPALWK